MTLDLVTVLFLLAGAGLAAFIAGFAGFGTALMASGLYFHALPAASVPPLIVTGSVIAHLTTMIASRQLTEIRPALPFLASGVIGVPIGVALLAVISADALRLVVGAVLISYGVAVLSGVLRPLGRHLRSRVRDAGIGGVGGILGGLAGLSGVLPMVWLQLTDASPGESRGILQAYNLVLLGLASATMALSGLMTADVLMAIAVITPASILGALIGNRAFGLANPALFRRVVTGLLLASGLVLMLRVLV
ncbi:MAG: sulfite exporter TauE/SafE family protein [Pseudomonadota bacterium]